MSGGSFSYVYLKIENGELLEGDAIENLQRAVERMEESAPGAKATRDSRALLEEARATAAKIAKLQESVRLQGQPLVGILHDLEWWDSGDTSKEKFLKSLADYEAKGSGNE